MEYPRIFNNVRIYILFFKKDIGAEIAVKAEIAVALTIKRHKRKGGVVQIICYKPLVRYTRVFKRFAQKAAEHIVPDLAYKRRFSAEF